MEDNWQLVPKNYLIPHLLFADEQAEEIEANSGPVEEHSYLLTPVSVLFDCLVVAVVQSL